MSPRQYPGLPPADPANACTNIDPRTIKNKSLIPLNPGRCSATEAHYDEKLEVGYRYYDAHDIQPAYCFG